MSEQDSDTLPDKAAWLRGAQLFTELTEALGGSPTIDTDEKMQAYRELQKGVAAIFKVYKESES